MSSSGAGRDATRASGRRPGRVVLDARAAQLGGWLGELTATYGAALAAHVDALVLDPTRPAPGPLPTTSVTTWDEISADPPAVLHVIDALGGRLPAALRAASTLVVVSVHDPRPLAGGGPIAAAALSAVRRADVLLAGSPIGAEVVAAIRPIGPWDVEVVGSGPRVGGLDTASTPSQAIVCPDGLALADGLDGVLAGYAALAPALRAAHPLVVATDEPAELVHRAGRYDLAPGRLVTVTRSAGPAAAAAGHAALVVAPGLERPILSDAMAALAAGVAVVCPHGPAAARVITHPARRFAPNDAAEASRALTAALTRPDLPNGAFTPASWAQVVQRTLEAYDRPAPRRRPAIAFVSPLPPEPTGVATYSRSLAEALGRRAVVTCFVPDSTDDDRRPIGTALASTSELGPLVTAGRFDEVVYALGNHPRHGVELSLLRVVPGAVELHDVRLVGAYAGLHAPGDALADELAHLYPGRYDSSVLRDPELSMGPAIAHDVWMTTEVAALATTVLTHSAHASALVEADSGSSATDIGPLAIPVASAAPPAANEAGPRWVVSAGVVDASKQSALLVEAFAAVVRDVPDAALVLVGPVAVGLRRQLRASADRLGIGGRVVLTGRLDDAAYDAELRRATVAVQLRNHTNGESSAAVTDCLARGLPTIVTAIGAGAELPTQVAVGVAVDVTPEVLGREITALLGDDARRKSLRDGALAFARENSFDAAADRLLTALFGPDRV